MPFPPCRTPHCPSVPAATKKRESDGARPLPSLAPCFCGSVNLDELTQFAGRRSLIYSCNDYRGLTSEEKRFCHQVLFPLSMFEPLFQIFERLVSDFSWRRVLLLIIFFSVVTMCVIGLENYGGYVRLARIEKSVQLLEKLAALQNSKSIVADDKLQKVYDGLASDLSNFVNRDESKLGVNSTLLRAIAGAMPWLLMCTAYISGFRKGDEKATHALLGCMIFAFVFGAIGAYIPEFRQQWINYVGYPLGHFFIFVILVMMRERYKAKKMLQGRA